MRLYFSIVLTPVLFPLQVWCQTVQDDWTAPAAPDGSTLLQSGSKFTLLWKSGLQNSFQEYCPSCDTKRLDLWITNFNGTKYSSKIGRRIDLTTSLSYDWNVNIASNLFSEDSFWVFRFTFFDAVEPDTQQVSSPGFQIKGLVKASSIVAPQSSSATSAAPESWSSATTSTSVTSTSATPSNSSLPQPTEQAPTLNSSPKNNTWIAGVVVGPLVGIALGAALMWFCLRKRKNKKAQQDQTSAGHHQSGHDSKEAQSATVVSDQTGGHNQYIAEAPADTRPVELWHGNYR
ncbi:hypothetical protein IQ07DRAFT_640490 [Pyrenochaeta sp. DS3sAY3a]|nr:hypothetical protein IQ07DRAFT_640490 [Pyrenochaeta sp. DS3sAY3a]